MTMASVRIAPSILAADFARLGEQIAAAEAAGAEQIHIDVMDGHFVPNISIGPAVVESIRRVTRLPLDTHLMISDPDRYLEAFAGAGSDAITAHVEASPDMQATIQRARALGVKAGVAIKPGTPVATLREAGRGADIWLIMTVEPGFGGQKYRQDSADRIRQARVMLDEAGSKADLSVDGGIAPENAGSVTQAGANVLVAGSAIFRAEDGVGAAISALRQAASR